MLAAHWNWQNQWWFNIYVCSHILYATQWISAIVNQFTRRLCDKLQAPRKNLSRGGGKKTNREVFLLINKVVVGSHHSDLLLTAALRTSLFLSSRQGANPLITSDLYGYTCWERRDKVLLYVWSLTSVLLGGEARWWALQYIPEQQSSHSIQKAQKQIMFTAVCTQHASF